MSNPCQFLVLLPGEGLSADPGLLEELARRILGVDPLTSPEKAYFISRKIAHYVPWVAIYAKLAESLSKRLDSNLERRAEFDRSKDLIVELLTRLATAAPETLLPGTRIFQAPDKIPAEWSSNNGTFWPSVVYAAHPADPQFFIPVATFHPYLIEDKRAEMVRLAGALGASEIRSTQKHHHGRKAEAKVRAKIPVEEIPVEAGVGASGHSSAATVFDLSANFPEPKGPPRLPEKLRWYHAEPLWKAMAETRVANGTRSFKVLFKYDQDYGVAADFVATLAGFGLSAGGTFNSMTSIEQEYEILFHPVK